MTYIGNSAFAYNSLSSLVLPNSVTYIGKEAIRDNSLTSITLPNSLTYIGELAFYRNYLTSVELPNSVIFIGRDAFDNNSLTNFVLPTPVLEGQWKIGTAGATIYSFSYDNLYLAINYNAVSSDFEFEDGKIKDYFGPGGGIILPGMINEQAVISIGDNAFSDYNLTSIEMPNSVKHIGQRAFYDNDITSLNISNSLRYIDNGAFNKNSLSSLELPNSVNYLGEYAFGSNSLSTLVIADSVTYIGRAAFFNNNLTSVDLPNSITYIGKSAFDRNSFTNFNLPFPSVVGYDLDGWTSSTNDNYSNGSTTSDLFSSYNVVVAEDRMTHISVLFDGFTGDLLVAGDETRSFTSVNSISFFVEKGENIVLTPVVLSLIHI